MTRVKWIKLSIDMFDDEKIKIIDSMPKRDLIHYVWIRLLVQAGKTNSAGDIFLNENIPYTKEMLSIIFNRSINEIEFSLKILSDLRMIEIDENNFINILNWEKHQNIEGMEKIREETRKRVQNHRNKKKLEKNIKDTEYAENIKYSEEIKDSNTSKDEENNVKNPLIIKEKSTTINDVKNHKNDNVKLETSCNVTVTEQSKRENKKEIKNKIKKETKTETKKMTVCLDEVDCNKNKKDCKCDFDTHESEVYNILNPSKNKEYNTLSDNKFILRDNVDSEETIEKYIKKLGVKIIGGSMSAIKLAVSIHGGANVKLAIERSLEVNKPRMNYINGILTNWKREGYPSSVLNLSKVQENIINSRNKTKVLSFNDFEPRKYDYDALEKALLGW